MPYPPQAKLDLRQQSKFDHIFRIATLFSLQYIRQYEDRTQFTESRRTWLARSTLLARGDGSRRPRRRRFFLRGALDQYLLQAELPSAPTFAREYFVFSNTTRRGTRR